MFGFQLSNDFLLGAFAGAALVIVIQALAFIGMRLIERRSDSADTAKASDPRLHYCDLSPRQQQIARSRDSAVRS